MAQSTVDNLRRPRARGGFTLAEMMIVIVVIGLMAALTAPPMFRYVESNRLESDTDRMLADLQYARSVAVSRGEILRFQATTAGYTLFNPNDGQVMRQHNFEHGLSLDADVTVDFFPWGMADAAVMQIANRAGSYQITLLPTGIVEVQ